jgi:hypothetical protein
MKKTITLVSCLLSLVSVAACSRCEVEPIIEQNHKLIVPPNFGNMPK